MRLAVIADVHGNLPAPEATLADIDRRGARHDHVVIGGKSTGMLLRYSLTVVLLVTAAGAAAQPSFDCTRASTEAERRICTDPTLAELDREIADVYAQSLDAFADDPEALAALREEQRAFIETRDRIAAAQTGREGSDLREFMGRRRGFLGLLDLPRDGFEGAWANGFGSLSIIEQGDGTFEVSVEAAEWSNARWLCNVHADAREVDGALRLDAGDGWSLVLRRRGALLDVAEERAATAATQRPYCGHNGFLEGAYFPGTTP